MKLELNVSLDWGLPVVIVKPDRSEKIKDTNYTLDDCISEEKRLCCFSDTYLSPMCNYAIGVSGIDLSGMCVLNKDISIIQLKGQKVINGSFIVDTEQLETDLDLFRETIVQQGFSLIPDYDKMFSFLKTVKNVIDDQIERYHLMKGEIIVKEYNEMIYQKYLDIDEIVSTMTKNQTQLQQLDAHNQRLNEQQSYVDKLNNDKVSIEGELRAKELSKKELEKQSVDLKDNIKNKKLELMKLEKSIAEVKKGNVPEEYRDVYDSLR